MTTTSEPTSSIKQSTDKAATEFAATAAHIDPWPHYIMSLATLGASVFAYTRLANPTAASIAAGIAFAYLYAGNNIAQGKGKLGYDIGSLASVGLLAATLPRAWQHGDVYSTALASAAGISTASNLLKSYEMRTNRPPFFSRSSRSRN